MCVARPVSGALTAHEIVSMLNKSRLAARLPGAALAVSMLISAASSGVAAENPDGFRAAGELSQAVPGFGLSDLQSEPLTADNQAQPVEAAPAVDAPETLQALVAATPVGEEISPEMKCLATAIYYESRSESLMGQLAVGRVIVNRAHSGRFPGSYCGVVYQPSQFSFNHNARGAVNARLWRNALAIAHIAHEGTWRCDAEGALYFHAARVSPNWGRQKVARIDNHIFYR